jgi:hypothetical protein
MYLIDNNKIPWNNVGNIKDIVHVKKDFLSLSSEQFSNYPEFREFKNIRKFIIYCSRLGFAEEPDYERLKDILKILFFDEDAVIMGIIENSLE